MNGITLIEPNIEKAYINWRVEKKGLLRKNLIINTLDLSMKNNRGCIAEINAPLHKASFGCSTTGALYNFRKIQEFPNIYTWFSVKWGGHPEDDIDRLFIIDDETCFFKKYIVSYNYVLETGKNKLSGNIVHLAIEESGAKTMIIEKALYDFQKSLEAFKEKSKKSDSVGALAMYMDSADNVFYRENLITGKIDDIEEQFRKRGWLGR
jgi:hypothetical protein